MKLAIEESYRGRHVLVTGTTGFLGKVWLAMALDRLPEIGRIYVLLRKKGLRPAAQRFEKMVGSSPVFRPLHEKHGADLGAYISERCEVVDGDISKPDLGMSPDVAARLKQHVDVIINCAGLVDFNPDIRLGVATNIDGALHAARFTAECKDASLVHVSTCYVAGTAQGRISETVVMNESPNGEAMDPHQELADLQARIDEVIEAQGSAENEEAVQQAVLDLIRERGLDENNATLHRNMTHRQRSKRLKALLTDEGEQRALALGWPNSYTYTKGLSEQLLALEAPKLGLRHTIFRPAVVESSVEFPFPGWNEGFNTSGPLVYLLGTWFRHLPCKRGNPFDVVPVDHVCNGLMIAGAAVMADEHRPVYQCGTSDKNALTIDRAVELTALGHRQFLRKTGETALDRLLLSRWDSVDVGVDSLFGMKNVRKTARGVGKLLRKVSKTGSPTFVRKRAERAAGAVEDADKAMKQVQKVCELFQPFVHDNTWYFETDALLSHDVQEETFRFNPAGIDWRSYWINIHMPGLRKWCFPQFEGKRIETYTPAHPFKLLESSARAVETVVPPRVAVAATNEG